jgi:hypothetical protein
MNRIKGRLGRKCEKRKTEKERVTKKGRSKEVVNKDKQAGIYKKGRFDGQALFSPIII